MGADRELQVLSRQVALEVPQDRGPDAAGKGAEPLWRCSRGPGAAAHAARWASRPRRPSVGASAPPRLWLPPPLSQELHTAVRGVWRLRVASQGTVLGCVPSSGRSCRLVRHTPPCAEPPSWAWAWAGRCLPGSGWESACSGEDRPLAFPGDLCAPGTPGRAG